MIDARAETAATKPAFRAAFKRWRCIVPANGFYEWQAQPGRQRKQPYYVHPAGQPFFGFAGLAERWQGPDAPLLGCAILTCAANQAMAPIHDRMPCILAPSDYARWLDPDSHDVAELLPLLGPAPDDAIVARPVGYAVGNARSEGPQLIEPLDAAEIPPRTEPGSSR